MSTCKVSQSCPSGSFHVLMPHSSIPVSFPLSSDLRNHKYENKFSYGSSLIKRKCLNKERMFVWVMLCDAHEFDQVDVHLSVTITRFNHLTSARSNSGRESPKRN